MGAGHRTVVSTQEPLHLRSKAGPRWAATPNGLSLDTCMYIQNEQNLQNPHSHRKLRHTSSQSQTSPTVSQAQMLHPRRGHDALSMIPTRGSWSPHSHEAGAPSHPGRSVEVTPVSGSPCRPTASERVVLRWPIVFTAGQRLEADKLLPIPGGRFSKASSGPSSVLPALAPGLSASTLVSATQSTRRRHRENSRSSPLGAGDPVGRGGHSAEMQTFPLPCPLCASRGRAQACQLPSFSLEKATQGCTARESPSTPLQGSDFLCLNCRTSLELLKGAQMAEPLLRDFLRPTLSCTAHFRGPGTFHILYRGARDASSYPMCSFYFNSVGMKALNYFSKNFLQMVQFIADVLEGQSVQGS